jgi:pimeloyl-ACP methyl ester carboxylesterase
MRESVILVHGVWLYGWTLALQRRRIAACGFRAVTFSYASVTDDLDTNARRLGAFSREQSGDVVHFVGHSLGGLLTLRMLEICPEPRTGRVVLVGSPWRSSDTARAVQRWRRGETLLGRSLTQWYASPRTDLGQRHDIGVIAGSLGFGVGSLVAQLERPHDGTVSVAETRLPTMADHLVLPVTHTGMLTSTRVAREACAFLKSGRFARQERVD